MHSQANYGKERSRLAFRLAGLGAAIATVLLIAAAGAEGPLAQEGGADSAEAPTATTVTQVMKELYNPRGLAFGPDGALYVAEAGRGCESDWDVDNDNKLDNPGPCADRLVTGSGGGTSLWGPTGAISRVLLDGDGTQQRIVTGLPSVAQLTGGIRGTAQAGPTDISFVDTGPPASRGAYVTIGLQANPALRTSPCQKLLTPEEQEYCASLGGQLGKLGFVPANASEWQSEWQYVADVAAYEAEKNPDPRIVDSNPYSVLGEPNGRVVADAGGNTLLRVNAEGKISLLATFPRVTRLAPLTGTTDAVPTSVVVGPDGAYYVGQLTGIPFQDGTANVYRVERDGSPNPVPVELAAADVYLKGFKSIIDIAFDTEGSLYVLQIASWHPTLNPGGTGNVPGTGKLIRVDNPGDPSLETRTTIMEELDRPTSVAVAPVDDDEAPGQKPVLYITNHGTADYNDADGKGVGEVLRIEQ